MDSYTTLRLFHKMLRVWWTRTEVVTKEYESECKIGVSEWNIDDFFSILFQSFPQRVILLSTDGNTKALLTTTEPTPEAFRKKRFMKIDNRVHASKNASGVFFQLLSIDVEDVSILDIMGLVQFFISFSNENTIDISSCKIIATIRKHMFQGPSFLNQEVWKKEIRDPILTDYYDTFERIDTIHESMLKRLSSCHAMIHTLCKTIDLFEERMDVFQERIDMFQERIKGVSHIDDSDH